MHDRPDLPSSLYEWLQRDRLAELESMAQRDFQWLFTEMAADQDLPVLESHFRRHRREFRELGVQRTEDYVGLFRAHIAR